MGDLSDRSKLTVCSYHVTYAFQSESTLYSCPNVKELLARSSNCNWTRTLNHLVRKETLNQTNTRHDKNIQSNAPCR